MVLRSYIVFSYQVLHVQVGFSFLLNLQTNGQLQPYPGFEQMEGTSGDPNTRPYAPYSNVSSVTALNLQVPMQFPQQATAPAPALLGKG